MLLSTLGKFIFTMLWIFFNCSLSYWLFFYLIKQQNNYKTTDTLHDQLTFYYFILQPEVRFRNADGLMKLPTHELSELR